MSGHNGSILFDVQCISFDYGNGSTVFSDLSFRLVAGQRVAILGRSGVGKSTLLHLLGLISEDRVTKGRITLHRPVDGQRIEYSSLGSGLDRAGLRLFDFGFVFQTACLLPYLTCRENIALPLVLQGYSRGYWHSRVEELLGMVEAIDGELIRMADRLGPFSGGQRQRHAVLRAIVHNPVVVFADEPLSNLDFRSARSVLAILRNWHEGRLHENSRDVPRTLLVATHDLEEAWDFCDSFLVFNPAGRLLENGAISKSDLQRKGGVQVIAEWMASVVND